MKTVRFLFAIAVVLATTACSNLPKRIEQLDKLGVKELTIPGRLTNTEYHREEKDGKIVTTLEHSNPWLSKPARLVRERPAGEP